MDDKTALRAKMRAKRAALSLAERAAAAQSIARHFADHPYLAFASSFAAYYPLHQEVDLLPLINQRAAYAAPMALPRMDKATARLYFHQWQPGAPLEKGAFEVREPLAEAEIIVPEVILAPLLAFDNAGHRLGYGAGWYDRTISALRAEGHSPLYIGVAYQMQEVASLPVEPHDVPLDGILTEMGVSLFSH